MMRLLTRAMLAMCLGVVVSFNAAQAQTRPKVTTLGPDFPKAALFVGNSFFYYNNGMPWHLSFMERAADAANKAAYRNTMVTIGGSGLDWHDMDNLLRPGGIGAYSFDEQNVVVFNKPGRQFEAVVMMDCSQCPIHPQLKDAFVAFAKKDSEIVRAHDMRPVLFMSWAYADKPEMTEGLAEAYTLAGNANDALVIPAGLAFARVRKLQPELNLYAPDKRHPSPAGTYLAACTTLAALTGRTPVGNSYTIGLDPETAQLLQKAAWDTVQEYYGL
ncbi:MULTISPECIES: DUF4886 domain-containing protein [Bradyrhizobium]|uniref:Blr4068 protein n=2 Tax=Bradyrhizobium diazoefficiens TaxID=1355477 RepID=Q89MX4_BRADU|nr:hypothetical protein [Bradyrhizobium diazoefficiens]MBP1065951.1 hypothetical protein [Bradyrhizobium japonicum]AND89369.1 hypothetical protein AAV28_17360 [Bradyrhizobium diazoefficiens USDA 110]AWO91006.1 hypothetical protein DI395_22555 [Bradyrhizobium diazoefficiens]MBP1093339.1 hypothetical protein [Bradyrhizobium japonicum]PDT61012.1 hypothetical protein CO678_14140 [Bradyrhizobium diazoefficiens]